MLRRFRQCQGFTMIELLASVMVFAVLVVLAIPAFQGQTQTRHIKGAADRLYAELQYARSESIKRNRGVHVNFTVTSASNWCYGLRDIADDNLCNCAATPANCTTSGQRRVVTSTDYPDVQITSGYGNTAANNLSFEPVRGMITPAADVTFSIGSKQARVRTTVLGQIQICAPSGSSLTSYQACP